MPQIESDAGDTEDEPADEADVQSDGAVGEDGENTANAAVAEEDEETTRKTKAGRRGARTKARDGRSGTRRVVSQIFLLLFVMIPGYRYGFGPLVSWVQKKPALIYVVNHSDVDYTVSLGWRRVRADLWAHGFCTFELYVGQFERQNLTLQTRGPGETVKMRLLPVIPGELLVVNANQAGTFGVFDFGRVAERELGQPLRTLAKQLATNRSPEGASAVGEEALRIAQSALLETRRDAYFTSVDYNLTGISQGMPAALGPSEKPFLVDMRSRPIKFADGRVFLDPGEPDTIDCQVQLPARAFRPAPDVKFRLAEPSTVEITGSPRDPATGSQVAPLRISLEASPVAAEWEQITYQGRLSYKAESAPKGGSTEWTWEWEFAGRVGGDTPGNGLELTVDAAGKVRASIVSRDGRPVDQER